MKIPRWLPFAAVCVAISSIAVSAYFAVYQMPLEGPSGPESKKSSITHAQPTTVIEASTASDKGPVAANKVSSAPANHKAVPQIAALQLLGVFTNTDSTKSYALISPLGAKGKPYHLDDVVSDDWRLVEIDSTSVTLARGTQRERLMLHNGNRLAEPPAGGGSFAAMNVVNSEVTAGASNESGYQPLSDSQIRSDLAEKLNALREKFAASSPH